MGKYAVVISSLTHNLPVFFLFVCFSLGGDKVPRKGGPGITQSDLLVVNKTDLAEAVGADLKVPDSLVLPKTFCTSKSVLVQNCYFVIINSHPTTMGGTIVFDNYHD